MAKKRLYNLFRKEKGKWVQRVGTISLPQQVAIHHYQNLLLSGQGWVLRPVRNSVAPVPPSVLVKQLGLTEPLPIYSDQYPRSNAVYALKRQPGANTILALARNYLALGNVSEEEFVRLSESVFCFSKYPAYDGGEGEPGDTIWLKR